ncbi:hypothetical protein [Paludisphaera mucosa]|uniref:Carboxypeptidase regulatory-like domain-containing protein n=1 Tax=Paludisphaera mucosa TaxID=3030827 RepID=A0ABT6FKV2_9BACT|nr:hypothetical protein [Paludisphaera mucosa]MDG3008213.1 hypothetical protein [Paludisphaera mucosa]
MRCGLLDARSVHALLLTCLVGCGDSRETAVHPVAGKLTVGGRPAANAMIAFHPLDRAGLPTALSVASTGSDGAYRLTTYTAGDGAPAGEYAVTVVWPDDSQPHDECEDVVMHDRFKGRYADPARSPWRVAVGPGANEVPLRADAPAGR